MFTLTIICTLTRRFTSRDIFHVRGRLWSVRPLHMEAHPGDQGPSTRRITSFTIQCASVTCNAVLFQGGCEKDSVWNVRLVSIIKCSPNYRDSIDGNCSPWIIITYNKYDDCEVFFCCSMSMYQLILEAL